MDRQVTLVAPDGTTIDAAVVELGDGARGTVATFRVSPDTWERIVGARLLHVEPDRLNDGIELLDGADSIDVEAALDPKLEADDESMPLGTDAWWALDATREVPLPEELAATGSLREGVSLTPPPWGGAGSELMAAWRVVADADDVADTDEED